MRWSWRLGEIAGIGIYVHATFFMLIAWIAVGTWLSGRSVGAAVDAVAFVLAIFACIVLHELGHALAARRYQIQTRDITLLPIGGVARLQRMPDEPRQELVVALAGPAVNLVIAALLGGLLWAYGGLDERTGLSALEGPFLQRLTAVNLALVGFNLLPAFPMDGGRALRALLASRMDYAAATQAAASIGQAMALLFGLVGLLVNPLLIFIALFVWIGAAAEANLAEMRVALAGIPVERVMVTEFRTLAPSDPLARAVELTLSGSQKDFPVVDGAALAGMLTQERLMAALERGERDAAVGSAMHAGIERADAREMLESALQRLESAPGRALAVVRDAALVGLVTLDNVGEFIRIQSALRKKVRAPGAAGELEAA
jgi:Zn-dependent protease